MSWPDLVIGFVALLFALKGWKRGFVGEVGGAVALAAAIWAALHYPGTFDQLARDYVHASAGSAHVVGMVTFAIVVYVAVLVIAAVLGRIARLPVIGIGNGAAGALVGIAKALVGTWVVLYVALFFPLTRDLRDDLHRSHAVAFVTAQNRRIDGAVRGSMPDFIRPLVQPLFQHHTV